MDIDTKVTIPLKDYLELRDHYQNTKGKQLIRIEKLYGGGKYVKKGHNGVKE